MPVYLARVRTVGHVLTECLDSHAAVLSGTQGRRARRISTIVLRILARTAGHARTERTRLAVLVSQGTQGRRARRISTIVLRILARTAGHARTERTRLAVLVSQGTQGRCARQISTNARRTTGAVVRQHVLTQKAHSLARRVVVRASGVVVRNADLAATSVVRAAQFWGA